jgi:hypothetical protein
MKVKSPRGVLRKERTVIEKHKKRNVLGKWSSIERYKCGERENVKEGGLSLRYRRKKL